MIKVAITGSTGLVGSRVVEILQNEFKFIPLTSNELDITNKENVTFQLKKIDFDLLLHLAAYTNVDEAEIEKELVHKVNVEGTKSLLDATLSHGKKFIFISTGFIFDGENPPYFEESLPHPISYYGQTKFEAEEHVKNHGMIVRIEYPYGNSLAPKKDFARTLKSLLEQKKTINAITDSKLTPTYIDDIASGLKHLINNFSPEIFHIVGSQTLSPFEAAKIIAKTYNLDESLIRPTTYAEYFTNKAKRPQWCEVKSQKNTFYKMKNFSEGLLDMK